MKRNQMRFGVQQRQAGVALIVSLILLAVISVMGITGMQMATQEFKMATSTQDRATAFAAAEAALTKVERNLATDPPDRENLLSTCTGSDCYNATCTGGLCFDGTYLAADTEWDCVVGTSSSNAERMEFWSDATLKVWTNRAKYKTLTVDNLDADVKYIIEFLCYVQRDSSTVFSGASSTLKNNGAPLFRVTALAEGNGGKGRVVLQSTYKVLAGQ